MINGREKSVYFKNSAFYCFPPMSKSSKSPEKGFWHHIKILLKLFKGEELREHVLPFVTCTENFNMMPEPFRRKLILRLLDTNRGSVFKATTLMNPKTVF